YAAADVPVDVFGELGTTPEQLTDAYLASDGSLSPLELVQSRVQDFLAARHPGVGYSSVLRTVQQRQELINFLPGALPYKVVSVLDEVPFLPDSFQHRVHLTMRDAAGQLLDTTLPVHRMAGHRAILTFRAASELDQQVIQTY